MQSTIQWLFTLLRMALWEKPMPENLPFDKMEEVLAEAERQTISGLVINQLFKNDVRMPQQLVFESVGMLEEIKQQNQKVNEEAVAFAKLMQTAQARYKMVKGQTLAAIYPDPQIRMPGDIDFLVGDNEKAKKIITDRWNVQLPEKMLEKETSFEHNEVTYELHIWLTNFGSKRHQKTWERLISEEWGKKYMVEIGGEKIITLSPTMNVAYVFLHLFFHLTREGVSLRQFCDWAMVLHHYHGEIDSDELIIILQDLELFDAFSAFGVILIDCLGLPNNEFPFAINNDDRKWKEKILQDIFRGGNFGKQNHKATTTFGYKFETMCLAIRNSIRYYKLAPSEMRMMIPKMIGINLKLLFN